ncbi:LOW QUALITY PROTEIN: E3 ubiquitin-protein ligase PUB22-like [Primulina tabacum]|uniref:LOW QUALITY PROTEIN: E3 ubiquitin-protein ligase PUB22-like n=1 Tax=Primulina tabacum TaxID=48773 RepID=UPI003F5A0911
MAEVEIPSYFLCPITLDMMKDPVTISTGITFDRDSIENWIFTRENDTCPVTKQVLSDYELIPNITLRRLIQSWCTLHSSHGIERLPTPRSPVSKSQVLKLLNDADSPNMQMGCLRRLKSIASENQANKRCMEAVGTADFLASFIVNKTLETYSADSESEAKSESKLMCEEALTILYSLHLSESWLESVCNQELVESLTNMMQFGSYESRAYAIMLLKSILEVADPARIVINLSSEFFVQCAQILNDEFSRKTIKSTLKVLINVCPWGRNRIKALEAGTVPLLIDLLLDSADKRACEMMLVVLEILCQFAEGRAELLNHSAGIAIVSKKILRISQVASERGVRILHSISKFSATPGVLQVMLHVGVVAKLCLVLQVDCGTKIKETAREMLRLHARAWRNSSCIPQHLICAYPS